MNNNNSTNRRLYGALALYDELLGANQYARRKTKWNKRIHSKCLRSTPFQIEESGWECLYIFHDNESEMLLTTMSAPEPPMHRKLAHDPWFSALEAHKILAFDENDILNEGVSQEIKERVCGFITFTADDSDLALAVRALKVRLLAPVVNQTWILENAVPVP